MPEPAGNHVKQTPGRRKPGPKATRATTSGKNYASENDVGGADNNFRPDFGHRKTGGGGGPTTPQKTQKATATATSSRSPAPSTIAASAKLNKRTGNNKPVPKNISTSPAPTKPGRRTPPQTAGPKASGAAAPAFAGATFHASPAPSSLPLPSFFSKSATPNTPRVRPGSNVSQEPSPPASDSEMPSSTATATTTTKQATGSAPVGLAGPFKGGLSSAANPPPRDESPLDIFFRADRAERERNRRASSANIFTMTSSPAPFSPPAQRRNVPDHSNGNTFPRGTSQHQQQQQQYAMRRPTLAARTSSGGITSAELDGTPGQPIGPAFSTPFQERIRAVRPDESKASSVAADGLAGFRDVAAAPTTSHARTPPQTSNEDRSEALKRFLFSKTVSITPPAASAPVAPAPKTPTRYPGSDTMPQPAGYGGSPFQSIYATPPTAAASRKHSNQLNANQNGNHGSNSNTSNNRNRNSSGNGHTNIAAMEDSLRQILKLDSPFGAGASSPGYPRRS
ncbi:proteophosphoglycan 5 [Niveomyces insectorum RCEF 264]|uniref:Proteophosphoglycan 5 n=1 Tax=Niveomyces insectorum RCEF 264 TaxID=1081102 RepID=A0A167QR91_9HYPO|nr:proteophosphoglycan 5 [Niveomyces insectorum RCEF 264]